LNVIDGMRRRLAPLQPLQLDIADESAHHAGHAGAQGGDHFRMTIVTPLFSGRDTLQRHRLIYDALGSMMRGQIHALSIKALAPEEL
jgi:BolA protein